MVNVELNKNIFIISCKNKRGATMKTVIKTLPAANGNLFVISAGQRLPLADFSGTVKITEDLRQIPMLGTVQKGMKKIHASFVVCGDLEYHREIDGDFISGGKVFEAVADVGSERLFFAGLRFEDSDPVENELIFEVTDLELIKKLLGM